jgi:CDK inhibitor PHO81
VSDDVVEENSRLGVARPIGDYMPNGVDGILKSNGSLRFNESIDM